MTATEPSLVFYDLKPLEEYWPGIFYSGSHLGLYDACPWLDLAYTFLGRTHRGATVHQGPWQHSALSQVMEYLTTGTRGKLPASSMANLPFLLLQLINIYLGVGGRDFQTMQISYFSLNFLLISPLILTSISGSCLQPSFLWCPHGDFLFSFFLLSMNWNSSVRKSCLF